MLIFCCFLFLDVLDESYSFINFLLLDILHLISISSFRFWVPLLLLDVPFFFICYYDNFCMIIRHYVRNLLLLYRLLIILSRYLLYVVYRDKYFTVLFILYCAGAFLFKVLRWFPTFLVWYVRYFRRPLLFCIFLVFLKCLLLGLHLHVHFLCIIFLGSLRMLHFFQWILTLFPFLHVVEALISLVF